MLAQLRNWFQISVIQLSNKFLAPSKRNGKMEGIIEQQPAALGLDSVMDEDIILDTAASCSEKSPPAVKQVVVKAPSPPKPPLELPDVSGYRYDERIPCPYCRRMFNVGYLHQHILIHSNIKPYGCSNCSYRSRWPGGVKRHKQKCCKLRSKPAKKVTAPERNHMSECGENPSASSEEFNPAPAEESPSGAAAAPPPQPPLEFPDLSGYKYEEKVLCPYCKRKFKAGYLHQHILIHSDIKPYSCSYCSFRSRWPKVVKAHEQRRCSYRGKSEGSVRAHEQTLTEHVQVAGGGDVNGDVALSSDRSPFRNEKLMPIAVKIEQLDLEDRPQTVEASELDEPQQVNLTREDPSAAKKELNSIPENPAVTSSDLEGASAVESPTFAAGNSPLAVQPGRQLLSAVEESSSTANPTEYSFACMLCNFVGITLESAAVHAATHNVL